MYMMGDMFQLYHLDMVSDMLPHPILVLMDTHNLTHSMFSVRDMYKY